MVGSKKVPCFAWKQRDTVPVARASTAFLAVEFLIQSNLWDDRLALIRLAATLFLSTFHLHTS